MAEISCVLTVIRHEYRYCLENASAHIGKPGTCAVVVVVVARAYLIAGISIFGSLQCLEIVFGLSGYSKSRA
jgi:hypothetical protein